MKRLALAALLVASCTRTAPPAPDASTPPASPAATTSTSAPEDGRALVKGACLSCHTEEMLAQQRLGPAQWAKVVAKMVGWGANLEAKDTEALTGYLAATYGPDAGAWEPETMPADDAPRAIAPLPDGPFAGGDPERGKALYTDKCSGCHGPTARGHIGVLLVERPLLWRAAEVAETVRRGRGKMAPIAMTDGAIADVLAHLRTLRNP